MTEQDRLKEIKELLAERDKYANVDGETDYSNYDKYINILNDDGHIDWLVERVQVLETSRKEIAESFRKTWNENQRYKQALEFYANENNYEFEQVAWDEWTTRTMEDGGEKARQALKGDTNA